MKELSLDEFGAQWARVEQAVDATPGIDPWCSGPDWTLAVNAGFGAESSPILIDATDIAGFAALARYETDDGRLMIGCLEPLWGFGAPIVGPNLDATTKVVIEYLRHNNNWNVICLTGFPTESCPSKLAGSEPLRPTAFTIATATALQSVGQVSLHPGIFRQTANLANGYESWLSNRSSTFRRNQRKATRSAIKAEIVTEVITNDSDLFDRLLAIEDQTWKGKDDSGITSDEMQRMYRTMFDRLSKRGRLMAHVACVEGQDAGFIVGGLRNRRYRGLQLSYVAGFERLSIGNLLQDHQIRLLCDSDLADTYDLGMDFDYKRSWADQAERSITIVVHPS